jgi:putative thioredoxin
VLGPILEKLEREYAGRFRLAKIDSDQNQALAQQLGVRSIPDVRLFMGGRPAGQFTGALPESQIRAFLDRLLPPPELALAQQAIAENRLDAAEQLLAQVKPDVHWDTVVETLRQAIAFARGGGGSEAELAAKLAANPGDLESRLALAGARAARHDWAAALEQLVEIVRRDKAWRDGEARKQALAIFNLASDQPDLVADYRRKLASVLY